MKHLKSLLNFLLVDMYFMNVVPCTGWSITITAPIVDVNYRQTMKNMKMNGDEHNEPMLEVQQHHLNGKIYMVRNFIYRYSRKRPFFLLP